MAQTMLTYDTKLSVFINAEQDEKGYLKTVSNIKMETKNKLEMYLCQVTICQIKIALTGNVFDCQLIKKIPCFRNSGMIPIVI